MSDLFTDEDLRSIESLKSEFQAAQKRKETEMKNAQVVADSFYVPLRFAVDTFFSYAQAFPKLAEQSGYKPGFFSYGREDVFGYQDPYQYRDYFGPAYQIFGVPQSSALGNLYITLDGKLFWGEYNEQPNQSDFPDEYYIIENAISKVYSFISNARENRIYNKPFKTGSQTLTDERWHYSKCLKSGDYNLFTWVEFAYVMRPYNQRNHEYVTSKARNHAEIEQLIKQHFLNIIAAGSVGLNEKQYSDYLQEKKNRSKGCYIASSIYGSYDCPEVWTLRRFRDYTLAETMLGRLFIALYYALSPTLVKRFGETQWFRNLWKPTLDKMVERLNRDGVADTPYQDRQW